MNEEKDLGAFANVVTQLLRGVPCVESISCIF